MSPFYSIDQSIYCWNGIRPPDAVSGQPDRLVHFVTYYVTNRRYYQKVLPKGVRLCFLLLAIDHKTHQMV